MQAGESACACPECGVVCEGLFDGCPDVWARGLRPVALSPGTAPLASTRALNAGPEPQLPPHEPPPPEERTQAYEPPPSPPPRYSPLANGFAGGAPPPPPREARPMPPRRPELPPPQPVGNGTRADVLKWFEDAFDDLRNELHAVVSTVTRQQAMLAELLDTRDAELRVVMVAESLPELAGEAAAKALADQTAGLTELVEAQLEDFRVAAEASDLSTVAAMDGMRELIQRVETTAGLSIQAANDQGALRLQALKASVSRQLKPVVGALADIAVHMGEAEEREAARTRALRASVAKAIQPLATALAAATERSDAQMAAITERLDAVAGPPAAARPAGRVKKVAVAKARPPEAASTKAALGKPSPRAGRRITT